MSWWHPDRLAARREALETRARMAAAVRRFFLERGFVEVETPALQVSPGLEPHLAAFTTVLDEPGEGQVTRHLHTSPEFAMKKLLVAGVPRLFQLARCFRNGERSRLHHPEFTMLEWYRAGASYRELMADCEALLRAAAPLYSWEGRTADPAEPWLYLSIAEAFQEWAGIDLLATAPDPERPRLDLLADAARPLGIAPHAGDDWEDLFFRIFLERIEPRLGIGAPAILYDYPISMAALARPKPGDPRPRSGSRSISAGSRSRTPSASSPTLPSSSGASRAIAPPKRPATGSPIRSTRTSSPRSNTACRKAPASRSASIGS